MCAVRKHPAAQALEKLQALRWFPQGAGHPKRLKPGLTVCAAGLSNSPLLPGLHQTRLAVTRVATAEAPMLGAPFGSQSRANGSGSLAMAFCKSRLTQPVRLTPIGFLRSTSAITLGSIRTRVLVICSSSGTFWACFAGEVCPE